MKFALFLSYMPLFTAIQLLIFMAPPLPLSVNPVAPLLNARQFSTTCGVGHAPLLPPSLKPFMSPFAEPEPSVSLPLPNAIQFFIVTTPIGPVAGFAYRSHPSSLLQYEIHPSNTFPSPHVSFAANPSAFSHVLISLLSYAVQLRIVLYDGHCSIELYDVLYLLICRPESWFA